MSDLNKSLQDYLSKSKANAPLLGEEGNSESKFNLAGWNPFKRKQQESYADSEDVTNGWFSQAQKDPLCPSLVNSSFFLSVYIFYRDIF